MEHDLQETKIMAHNSHADTKSIQLDIQSIDDEATLSNRVQSWVRNTQHDLWSI